MTYRIISYTKQIEKGVYHVWYTPFSIWKIVDFLHHAAHTSHAGSHTGCGTGRILFFLVGNHTLGGEEHTGNRSGIFKSYTGNLGRVDNTSGKEVLIFTRAGIVSEVAFAVFYFLYQQRHLLHRHWLQSDAEALRWHV